MILGEFRGLHLCGELRLNTEASFMVFFENHMSVKKILNQELCFVQDGKSTVNYLRILFVVVFLLSAFICAKSYVAVSNVEQWTDEIRSVFRTAQSELRDKAYLVGEKIEPLNKIQTEWAIMRPVSVGLMAASIVGIWFSGKGKK